MELIDLVDDRVNAFNDFFLTCLDNHAPIKTLRFKRKSNTSITAEIKKRIRTRNKRHKRARKSGSHEDWKVFADLRREIKQSIRQAEREYFTQQVITNKGKPAKPSQRPYYALAPLSSLLSSLCQISRVRHLFSKEVLYIMINSIVF